MVTVMSYLPEARFIGFHRHGIEMNEVVFHCLHHMLWVNNLSKVAIRQN